MSVADRAPPITGRSFSTRVALFYGALFVVYGAQLPFLPLWLEQRGLTPTEIGLATSLPLLARLFVAPAVAIAADRHHQHKGATVVLAALAAIAVVILPAAGSVHQITALVLVFLVAIQSSMPLVETIAMRGVRGADLDYGRMRLWGSLTFIAANLTGGWLIEAAGRDAIVWLIVAGTVSTLLATLQLPAGSRPPRPSPSLSPSLSRRAASLGEPIIRLLRSRGFLLLLVAAGTIQASHAMFYTFGAVRWREQGLGTGWIGALWAIGVIVEVGLFALSARAVGGLGSLGLLLLGGLAGILRWTAMAFDPPLALLLPLQVLHAATFGATHLATMHLIASLVDDRDAGTAQSLHAMTSSGIAMGVAVASCGPLYDAFSARGYLAMSLLAAVGTGAAFMLSMSRRTGAG